MLTGNQVLIATILPQLKNIINKKFSQVGKTNEWTIEIS